MFSFLFSASVTLVLLSILPISIAFLADMDGDLIKNGGAYYIIPLTTTSGGLTYTQKHQECPLYITPEKSENSPGTPVLITTPLKIPFIRLNDRVSLAFQDSTHCNESLVWRQTLNPSARKLYITTGLKTTLATHFSITKIDKSLLPLYQLNYWSSYDKDVVSSSVGLYEDDGLLGITEYPTHVYFQKAFNVLELPTS